MPNTRNVDERVVEMRLDNKGFEEGAHKTISTLEKLEKALHLKGDTKAFDDMTESVSKFDANPMVSGLEKIKDGFSALEIVGMRVISNLTDSVYNFATRTIKSFTIDPIMQGMGKFGEKTTAVSTLTAQGYELEKVNKLMEDLNWFTDETSYNFTDMVGNIAKFTATGQDLDESVTAMEGIALWAAVSGQNAQKASMAMYQLSQAMGKGALKYDDYKSIQNASMDTQEFRKQAAEAAVQLGYLKQVAEDVWETTEKTAKSGQSFDLAGLFSSDALSRTSWLSSEVMMNVFNRYSKAVAAVQKYLEEHNEEVDTASEAMERMEEEAQNLAKSLGISLDDAFKKLGYDLDEFSLKALKAGQNARTWGDVVDSVKDAVSTGWMTTFEHLFGDAETATKFWTDIANKFYDIFAEGGNTRNSILELAFGKGSEKLDKTTNSVKNMTGGWERFQKRLESSGKSMEDFEKALYSVADRASLDAVENFNSVEEALRKGGISADLFKKAMDALLGTSNETMAETDANAQHASHSLEEMREVATGILRGDYGNGEERRKLLEEMGYDYELMQAMAGDLRWGGLNMSDEKLIEWMELYYQYNNLGSRLGANSFAEYLEQTAAAAEDASVAVENYDDIYDAVVHGIVEVDEAAEDAKTGGEYFRGAILNIIDAFMSIQDAFRNASETVFGKPEQIAVGLYKLVKAFYNFTNAMQLSKGTLTGLTTIFTVFLSVVKGFGTVLKFAGNVGGKVLRAIMGVADAIGTMLGKLSEYKILENFGKAFVTVFEAFGPPLDLASQHIATIFGKFRDGTLPGVIEKIGKFLEKISEDALAAAESFKEFLTSARAANAINTAFGYVLYYLRAIKNGFKDVDLIGDFEKLYNWIKGIFVDIDPDSSGVLLALEDISDTVEPITRGIMGEPEEVQNRIRTFFETIKNTIKEELKKYTFTDLLNALKVTAMTVFLAKLAGFVEQVRYLTKNIASIPEAIAGTIEKAGDVLVAFRKSVMAEAYIKIAAAIGILAASLWVLSKIPQDDLTHVATVIGILMLVLSALVKHLAAFGKFGENSYNIGNKLKINVFNGLAAKLIGLAAVLATVVAALMVVRKINPTTIVTTLIGIAVVVGGLALVIKALSELPNYNAKGVSLTLVSLAFALQMLMLPMAELALFTLDPKGNAYMGAVFGIVALLAALTGVIAVFSKLDKGGNMANVTKMAGSMALIALSIGLLLVPLISLAALPGGAMGKAIAALLGLSSIIAIMALAFSTAGGMEGSGNVIKIAAGMALFALALNMMIPVLAAFGSAILVLEKKFTWEKIKDNLLPLAGLAGVLIAFGIAATFLGKGLYRLGAGMVAVVGSFALFSVAILALSFALEHMGDAFPSFVNGLVEAGRIIRTNEANFIWGAVAFTVFAASIGLLVKSMSGLFKLGNVGAKLTKFTGAVGKSVGDMLKSFGKTIMDHLPSMLELLGSIVVLVALYLLDIIPQMTEIAVQAFTEFFDSLARSMESRKSQFVGSITSIVKTIIGVVKEVFNNLLDETTFGERLFMITAIVLTVLSRVSTAMIGTNGSGGLLGAFTKLTGGATAAAGTMAATTTATMSSLFWWIVGIAALIYGVYDGVRRMEAGQKEQEAPYLEGHEKNVEGLIHALENATQRYNEAYNTWTEEFDKFNEGTSDKTWEDIESMQRAVDAEGAAIESFKAQLRESLGLSNKEFKSQLNAAGGNYAEMDAVKEKLEEIKQAAKETGDAANDASMSLAGSFSKENQLETVRSNYESLTQELGLLSSEAGTESGTNLVNGIVGYLFGDEGSAALTDGGGSAADTTMNGFSEEMVKNIPYVGSDTVNGLLSGIFSKSNDLFNGGSWMYDRVDAGYRSRSRTRSPSREMMMLGEYAVDGLVLGIVNQSSDLDAAGDQLADNLMSAVSDAMSQVAVMANDEFEISPKITPVVDTASMAGYDAQQDYEYWDGISKAQDKIYQTQQDQRQEMAQQMGEVRSLWDEYAVRADELGGTVEYSLDNSKMSGLVSDISNKVDALGQQIANMRVVLDSGRLVGGIASNMDRQLGVMSTRRARGN